MDSEPTSGLFMNFAPMQKCKPLKEYICRTIIKNCIQFKFGVAVLDLGSILYKRDAARSGDYTFDINNGERLYLEQLRNKDVDQYNQFFKDNPAVFCSC